MIASTTRSGFVALTLGGDMPLNWHSGVALVSAAAGPQVDIDSGPGYELLISLLVFGSEADAFSYDVGLDWFTEKRARLSPELQSALEELAPERWLWLRLLGLTSETRERKQPLLFREFIERIRNVDATHLYGYLLGHEGPTGPITAATVQKARVGSPTARLKIGRYILRGEPTDDSALERFLRTSPERVKDLIVHITSHWHSEIFRDDENRLALLLAGEARTKRIIGRSSPARLLRSAAVGFNYLPRRAITRILLIPSLVCGPWVLTTRLGSARVFFYPIVDEPAEREMASAQLVKVHRALADFERLRILRALNRHEGTLFPLSQTVGLPPVRTRAQLAILRDAGLVSLRMDERRTTYQIRSNLASVVFRTLQGYLPEGGGKSSRLTA